jgi:hypothetical protein
VWGRNAPGVGGDAGGPFALERTGVSSASTITLNQGNWFGVFAPGGTIGYTFGSAVPWTSNQGSDGDLNAFGTSAIARSIPTNPVFSAATALGELRRDGLPSLPGLTARDQTALSRKAGSEYLNIEFGWLPLVRDIRTFAFAVRNSHKLISQYVKDSDKKIRRRTGGPRFSATGLAFGSGNLYPAAANINTSFRADEVVETKYWFSGAFRYHVPMGSSNWDKLRRYEQLSNYLLGTRITPEVLWNVAPWSWAVDWFTNTGDVMTNISRLGSDGLVMQYGYAMRQSRLRGTVTHTTTGFGNSVPPGLSCSITQVKEFKKRVAANPYGFGIDDLSLSQRQLAVLAALGLTREKRYR